MKKRKPQTSLRWSVTPESRTRRPLWGCVLLLFLLTVAPGGNAYGSNAVYKRYTDPSSRFSFDYPATMAVTAANPDEVKISHKGATLRINVFVEKRTRKGKTAVEPLLEAFKSRLKQEMKEASILEQGKLPGSDESQGYIICSFRDQRGIMYVQLVQYFVTEDSVVQMIISDRPKGFANLETVIRKVHASMKIDRENLGK